MRIGIVSDIHANYKAFRKVLEHMPEVDRILCAGDLVGYGVNPNPVADELREREKDFICVQGNHDKAVVTKDSFKSFNHLARQALTYNKEVLSQKNLEFISGLLETWRGTLGQREIFMAHGSPRRPLQEYIRRENIDHGFLKGCFGSNTPDTVVLGHTHIPYVKQVSETLVLNPGSVGMPRDHNPRASYALLDTEKQRGEIYRVEYDVEEVAEKIREQLSPLLGDRLEKGM